MHEYRTNTCGELRSSNVGQRVRLSGWINKKRDLGGVLFIDLRDNFGLTQIKVIPGTPPHGILDSARVESVITAEGIVQRRPVDSLNLKMPTGEIEIEVEKTSVQSLAEILPFTISEDCNAPETTRLTYRFLDLRRKKLHENILLRSRIISSIRRRMIDLGFTEFQTPILTSSSPEGARDYLVPSRVYPGKFYALPQAPQQFKQLLMVSGFDKYFQIAPCFRDEDARADRSPGEFYQLDLEMSFVTQDDVFENVEKVMYGVFKEFSTWEITSIPFPRIPYDEAMLKYGTDKPDLRFGLEIRDLTEIFKNSEFKPFREAIANKGVVRAIPVPGLAEKSRKFFEELETFAKENGGKGLATLHFTSSGEIKGSLSKPLTPEIKDEIRRHTNAQPGTSILFAADSKDLVACVLGKIRLKLADILEIRKKDVYAFCWITDFPMYELDPETSRMVFCHNPFSMPQGGLQALESQDPLTIKAFQYDIVCNGIELSSGAIRNHRPDIMYKAFAIAGYSREDVEKKFGGMIRAFNFGAPPHGGIAPGIDRIVMLIANEPNIREVIAFPMNQNAQDLLMGAPGEVSQKQLDELNIKIVPPSK